MTITPSSIALTAIDQMFAALEGVLKKAAADAKARNIEDEVYLNWRIAPDMFPLARQIRVATELPVRALSRMAGVEPLSIDDNEQTFDDFLTRIEKTRTLAHGLDAAAIDASPEDEITVPISPEKTMTMRRAAYLQTFILPNLYFHVSASYMILRHLGVDIGKRDFLAAPE